MGCMGNPTESFSFSNALKFLPFKSCQKKIHKRATCYIKIIFAAPKYHVHLIEIIDDENFKLPKKRKKIEHEIFLKIPNLLYVNLAQSIFWQAFQMHFIQAQSPRGHLCKP